MKTEDEIKSASREALANYLAARLYEPAPEEAQRHLVMAALEFFRSEQGFKAPD